MMDCQGVVLLVIDLQENLLAKIPVADEVLRRSKRLVQFARALEIPILWTEQYPRGLGTTAATLTEQLTGLAPLEKLSFGCFGAAGFPEAVAATGRDQLLIIGVEAHVCVMQTVLVAMERGFQAYVVRDAVASRRRTDYKAGLARMQANGAQIVTAEMAMFEMLRVAGTPRFKKILPLIK